MTAALVLAMAAAVVVRPDESRLYLLLGLVGMLAIGAGLLLELVP